MYRPTGRHVTPIFAAAILGLTGLPAQAAYEAAAAAPAMSPKDMAVILVSGTALALLFVVWRRPGGARDAHDARPKASSRAIVSLSCSHCGRVVDLPRDRMLSRLFCPRCGRLINGE